MNICLVAPTLTPSGTGIGFREKDCELFAMSSCCRSPIHYDLSSGPAEWVCSSCRTFIRRCDLTRDAVRRSASGIPRFTKEKDSYVIEELKTFVWWWTGYSVDDIQIEVAW